MSFALRLVCVAWVILSIVMCPLRMLCACCTVACSHCLSVSLHATMVCRVRMRARNMTLCTNLECAPVYFVLRGVLPVCPISPACVFLSAQSLCVLFCLRCLSECVSLVICVSLQRLRSLCYVTPNLRACFFMCSVSMFGFDATFTCVCCA